MRLQTLLFLTNPTHTPYKGILTSQKAPPPLKICLVQATPIVEDLGAVHTGLLRPLHSNCRDTAKKIRCRQYPNGSAAIHRADVVLFGLGLLYFPRAGQKTAVYHVSCIESVCTRALRRLYPLWDSGGSVTLSVGSIFFYAES